MDGRTARRDRIVTGSIRYRVIPGSLKHDLPAEEPADLVGSLFASFGMPMNDRWDAAS
jgi:hypothetical protein